MTKKRIIEAGKSLLIILLLASALVLARETNLFNGKLTSVPMVRNIAQRFRSLAERDSSPDGSDRENRPFSPAASPFFMAVTWEDGARYGVKYDDAQLNQLYGRFSVALGEALGSSGKAEPVTDAEWKEALSGAGVFFDFLYDQPLSVLSGWLGSSINDVSASHTVRHLCLAGAGDDLVLYYIRSKDGRAYRCDTALDFSYISPQLENYAPNGAQFAFELGEKFKLLYPYTMLLKELPEISSVTVTNPLHSKVTPESLLSIFNMNSFVANSYTETDGSVVYVEGSTESESTLRVDSSGSVSYSQTGMGNLKVSGTGPIPGTVQVIEKAFSLVNGSLGAWCGDAALSLSKIAYNPLEQTYTVCFDYIVNGLPVFLAGGERAAEIKVKNGVISKAALNFREFGPGSELQTHLPEIQAAAAVMAKYGEGEPLLVYEETGSEISAVWVKN